jgi:hypothetical protein
MHDDMHDRKLFSVLYWLKIEVVKMSRNKMTQQSEQSDNKTIVRPVQENMRGCETSKSHPLVHPSS